METLSVGVLIDVMYPYTFGGAEKRCALLAQEMHTRGHDVTVYPMKWWNGPDRFDHEGVHYVAVTPARNLYSGSARRSLLQPAVYALHAMQGSAEARHDLMDCNQFPLIHVPTSSLGALVRRHALAITWHEVWRSYWFRYAPLPASIVGAALEEFAPWFAKANIAVSQHTAARLRAAGVPASRVPVVPNPIDLARIDRAPPDAEPSDIIFAGRLIAHKRVDLLIAAVAKLRDETPGVKCVIVGTGPDEARLRALSAGLGLRDNVSFRGALEDEEALLGLLKASRLFVSASEREGFGMAALEAMACRLPVVTVQGPMNAIAEDLVVHGYNGLVVPAARSRVLAAHLAAALDDEPSRRRMAGHARLTAEEYDRQRVGASLEKAYRAALGAPAPKPSPARKRAIAPARVRS